MKIPANSPSESRVRRFMFAEHFVAVGRHESLERVSDEHEGEVIVEPVFDLRQRVRAERLDVAVQEAFAMDAEEVEVSSLPCTQPASQRE